VLLLAAAAAAAVTRVAPAGCACYCAAAEWPGGWAVARQVWKLRVTKAAREHYKQREADKKVQKERQQRRKVEADEVEQQWETARCGWGAGGLSCCWLGLWKHPTAVTYLSEGLDPLESPQRPCKLGCMY
jgi:hypothetical protein